MKLKVGLIAHYGEDYYKSRRDFLNFLEEKGVESFSMVPKDDYEERINQLGNRVFYYAYSRNWRFVFSLFQTYKSFVKILSSEKPDILFTYKFFPNVVGILAASKSKVPMVVATIAGIGFLENKDKNLLIKFVFGIYMKILNKANIIVVQNKEDLAMLSNHLDRPKLILTHGSGINPKSLTSKSTEIANYCKINNLDPSQKYLVFCSRIVRGKGIIELINAFTNVEIDYNLIIAGWFDEKGLEEEVINLIKGKERIHYLGYQKDVSLLLDLSEVIILPSYYPEGVPRSLIEALAKGKIIITTDHKGCRETCNNKNGFLVEPKSVDSIEQALLDLNKLDEDEKSKYKNESLNLFNTKFDRNIVFKTIWDGINKD
ncbi:glycosyltransferase [Sphingobacterium mizutaii]|uniref:glycosyltransferase n=1 Tax=Sphingobacterium mizutaii TaxID=1010 RepID=UPI0028A95D24|nr:glycosyltransferase [Sphingobacterium mizutaii]